MSYADAVDTSPSMASRQLYSRIVARADNEGNLSLCDTIKLAVDLQGEGSDPEAKEVNELIAQGWLKPGENGSWQIDIR